MYDNIGFINQVSTHPKATLESYKSTRNHYPTNPFFISVDGDCSSYYIEQMNQYINCEWLYNSVNLGYPPYEKENVLEWFKRLYIGVSKLNTKYFMMIEDDVFILNPIIIDDDIECFGHNIINGNKIHPFILEEIERISKVKPVTDFYGAGGGSIFKSKTFLENYHRIMDYFDQWWILYKLYYYPQSGYMDCFMVLFYLLCGKPYTPNVRMLNLDPHDPIEVIKTNTMDYSSIFIEYHSKYDIVHNCKVYY